MRTDINIYEATEATPELANAIAALLPQLSTTPHPFGLDDLKAIVSSKDSHLFILAVNGQTAGMITLAFYTTPTGRKAWAEDLVVDSSWRGHSFGKLLINHVIQFAEDNSPCQLMLTSRPSRTAANALYKSIGFAAKETNVYKMSL